MKLSNISVRLLVLFLLAGVISCDVTRQQYETNRFTTDTSTEGFFMHQVPLIDNKSERENGYFAAESMFDYYINYSSLMDSSVTYPYGFNRFGIDFPEHILDQAAGKNRALSFMILLDLENKHEDSVILENGKTVIRVVNKLIPDSDEAEELVLNQALTFAPGSNLHQILDNQPGFDFSEFIDEFIIVSIGRTACEVVKSGVEICEPAYNMDGDVIGQNCIEEYICLASYIPPPPDPDPPPSGGGDENDSGGDGGSNNNDGGGISDLCDTDRDYMDNPECLCNDPFPPAWCDGEEEPEPCDTGNEVVDVLAEAGLFQELFDMSNENDGLLRIETAAFANSLNASYSLLNPDWFGSCSINIPDEFMTPDTIGNIIPPGANTLIHTHYWEAGEPMIGCIDDVSIEMLVLLEESDQLDDFIDMMGYNIPNYANQMSRDDLAFMQFLFENTDVTNFIVIDNETIMIVTPDTDNPQQPNTEPRCGY